MRDRRWPRLVAALLGDSGPLAQYLRVGYRGKDLRGQRIKILSGVDEEGSRMIIDMQVVYIVAGMLLFVFLAGGTH